MPPLSSCLRGFADGGDPPPATSIGPNISTSIYESHLGFISLTWSRTLLGLSLNASINLNPSSSSDRLHFKIHPWIFWKRKGTRRFRSNAHKIYIAWNLTRARFPPAGSPEPSSGFFVAVAVDGRVVLVAGDMSDEAQRKMKAKQRSPTMAVSRKEQVVMKGRMGCYRSAVRIGGADREIWIEINGGMAVSVDGKRVVDLRRVRWKFRGSQWVEIGDGGGRMLISWDLYAWFFPVRENLASASAAVFVFCFESEWESSGKGRKKSLLETWSSSSSYSSAASSSAASSSVMDWWSSEEAEMRGVDGFTLVVYAWKH